MAQELCAVAIMAKASIVGTVKTRLVPPLTPEEAAELNTCCLADIAANIVAAAERAPISGFAAYHPSGSEEFFENLLPDGFELLPPREPTLGRSLFHAASDLFAAGFGSVCLVNGDSPTLPTELLPPREPTLGRSLFHAASDLFAAGFGSVCLVNGDSPTLPTDLLVEAARHLQEPGERVVLGPAADGGYYLIGMKRVHPRLFEEIDWSTERVFRQTIARAREIGLAVAVLGEWYDVDDEPSLAQLASELLRGPDVTRCYNGGYAAPRTAALLEKFAATNTAVRQLLRGKS